MNFKEMRERLNEGEDPLELSIQAWKDKEGHIASINDLRDYNGSLDCCALCQVYGMGGCQNCPTDCTKPPFTKWSEAFACDNYWETLYWTIQERKHLESLRKK